MANIGTVRWMIFAANIKMAKAISIKGILKKKEMSFFQNSLNPPKMDTPFFTFMYYLLEESLLRTSFMKSYKLFHGVVFSNHQRQEVSMYMYWLFQTNDLPF